MLTGRFWDVRIQLGMSGPERPVDPRIHLVILWARIVMIQ